MLWLKWIQRLFKRKVYYEYITASQVHLVVTQPKLYIHLRDASTNATVVFFFSLSRLRTASVSVFFFWSLFGCAEVTFCSPPDLRAAKNSTRTKSLRKRLLHWLASFVFWQWRRARSEQKTNSLRRPLHWRYSVMRNRLWKLIYRRFYTVISRRELMRCEHEKLQSSIMRPSYSPCPRGYPSESLVQWFRSRSRGENKYIMCLFHR